MKPIKIAILGTQGIPARYGGYETFAEELSTRLVQQGFEITVYCPVSTSIPQPLIHQGVRLKYIKSPGRGGLANILFDIWCLFACLGRHDIVYICGYGASFMAFLPRIFGARVWINLGGLEWKRSKWPAPVRAYVKVSEWLCGQTANRLICDARAILDYYASEYRSRAELSFLAYGVAPLPLNEKSRDLLPPPLTPFGYDVLVSRLEPENNIKEIIEGYMGHRGPRPLVVIGNLDKRPYVDALRSLADDRIIFLGGVYDKEKLAALRRFAFVAFHGHSVGGTNPSLLEAIAAGRPILAHDNPFNREVGGPLLRFFKAPSDIPPQLALIEAQGPAESLDQTQRAKDWLDEHYSWDQIASDYASLFREDLKCTADA
jgi:glycosyltransferase involved in cell wall biosynthesis